MRFGTCSFIVAAGRQSLLQRNLTVKTIVLFFLLLFVSDRAWSEDFSFFQPGNPDQLDGALINTDIVKRIRSVYPALDTLAAVNQGELGLNLFDDTHIHISIVRQDRTLVGQTLWRGRVTGSELSYALLVSDNKSLSGEIIVGNSHYQIRPWREDLHIVREVHYDQSSGLLNKASGNTTLEAEVIVLVNKERAANSLDPLVYDSQLTTSARGHATEMADNNYFSSYGLDGSSASTRIVAAGYLYNSGGENMAYGYATSVEVMNMWMINESLRKNILGTTYCDIGVGYAYEASSEWGHYWVQDFGRRQGVTDCSASSSQPLTLTTILSLLL
jgi:uncharacterized protein YkwD